MKNAFQLTNRPCHELRIYASVPPKIGKILCNSQGLKEDCNFHYNLGFLALPPQNIPGPEDILPASSRSTRRFHLGKLHVELIDPRGASLSLLKRVGPLPNMCFDIEAGDFLGGVCSSTVRMSTPERIHKEHRWETRKPWLPPSLSEETITQIWSGRTSRVATSKSSVWGTRQKKPWHATVR